MNRLQLQDRIDELAPPAPPTPSEIMGAKLDYAIDAGRYAAVDGEDAHALFAPMHYEPNYAYPLIVWLHGPRDDERQLKRIMPILSMRNFVAVGPRGTLAAQGPDGPRGYQWSQEAEHFALAEQRVMSAIHSARKRYNIATDRIFLAGLEAGGGMAFRIGLSHPRLIRGVLSIGGSMPTGCGVFSRLREVRKLPLFLAAMRDSKHYPPAQVCEDLRLLHSAGMTVHLRQYPCGDELTTEMLADVNRWIMEQIGCC